MVTLHSVPFTLISAVFLFATPATVGDWASVVGLCMPEFKALLAHHRSFLYSYTLVSIDVLLKSLSI